MTPPPLPQTWKVTVPPHLGALGPRKCRRPCLYAEPLRPLPPTLSRRPIPGLTGQFDQRPLAAAKAEAMKHRPQVKITTRRPPPLLKIRVVCADPYRPLKSMPIDGQPESHKLSDTTKHPVNQVQLTNRKTPHIKFIPHETGEELTFTPLNSAK